MRRWLGAVALLSLAAVPFTEAAADGSAPTPATDVMTPMAEHADKVVGYTLRATLDPVSHTVHGEGTVSWKNVSEKPVSELWFHLYLNAFKNQRSVFMREPVGGFRGTTIPKDWGTIDLRKLTLDGIDLMPKVELRRPSDEDETDARVPLPREVAPGETITLEMTWDDKLPTVVERTGYDGSFHMVAQWFPKIAKIEKDGTFAHFPFHHLGEFYADYGTYDVTLDVPHDYVIGATGPKVASKKTEGGRLVERHVQDDVHDFAWTAWNQWRKRKETIDGVDVTILYPPNYDDIAERELETMRFALPHYGDRYGKYPYGVLTLVHPPSTSPEAGGMEYPTLITTGGGSWTPRGVHTIEMVTIHEFGHQYFYGLLASNEVKWPFLDEGLNSYAESEAMPHWKGAGSGLDLLGLTVGVAETHGERARHVVHDDKIAQPAYTFGSGTGYGSLVYSRTAAIVETLRRVYGDDKLRRTMRTYARRFRFKHPTPDDLIATFREVMGEAVATTLRTALFDKGWIDYAITHASSHPVHTAAGIFDLDGKRETVPEDKRARAGSHSGWVLVARRGTLALPVEIELIAEDGTKTRVPWDGDGDSMRVPYKGSSPLHGAIVDPDGKVLLDQDRSNDFTTLAGRSTKGAPNTWERATYWAEILLGGLSP